MKLFCLVLTLLFALSAFAVLPKMFLTKAGMRPCRLCFIRLRGRVRFRGSWSFTNGGGLTTGSRSRLRSCPIWATLRLPSICIVAKLRLLRTRLTN